MGQQCIYKLQFFTGDQEKRSSFKGLPNLQLDLDQIKANPRPPHHDQIILIDGKRDQGQFFPYEPVLPSEVKERIVQIGSIKKHCYSYNRSKNIYDQSRKYFKFQRTGIVYAGNWENGKIQDFGANYYPSGAYYEGTFLEAVPHGYGLFINPNGDYYEGKVKYGLADGEGFYKTKNVQIIGQFKDNLLHGEVQQKSKDYYFKGQYQCGIRKSGLLKYKGNIYEGEFMEDLFEGEGMLITAQGCFKGNFHKGLQQGYGQFQWKNKNKYCGDYKKGIKSGYGEYINCKSHTICRGMWEDGLLQGNGQYIESSGKAHKVVWKHNKITKVR